MDIKYLVMILYVLVTALVLFLIIKRVNIKVFAQLLRFQALRHEQLLRLVFTQKSNKKYSIQPIELYDQITKLHPTLYLTEQYNLICKAILLYHEDKQAKILIDDLLNNRTKLSFSEDDTFSVQ